VIHAFVSLVPRELLDCSGAVFYSGREAFTGERPVYLLGLNPGGDPVQMAHYTVRRQIDQVLTALPERWSAFRDESWQGARPGAWGMQPRVLHLLRRLRLDPGEVPASNLAFVRSRGESGLGATARQLAAACWPFHQRVMEGLGVRVVVCFGRTTGEWVRERMGARELLGTFVEQNSRRWTSLAHRNSAGLAVVTTTHPSRVDWTSPRTDPSDLVLQALA